MARHAPLTFNQRRVLGALIEKSATTPEQYPLTVNALVAACNQKSNRDPVVSLTENDVIDAIQELKHMGFIRRAETDRTARAVRFEHLAPSALGWSPREQAILAELLLRGPQTAGELRTRGDRMHKMPDLAFANDILSELVENDPPLVRTLPRAPGQSAVRHDHTLYADGETIEPTQPASDPIQAQTAPATPAPADRLDELARRIADLERRVTELENRCPSS